MGGGQVLRYVVNACVVGAALCGWFWSQALLGARPPSLGDSATGFFIGDRVHDALTPLTETIRANKAYSDALLAVSSAAIDVMGVFFLLYSVFGPSVRPMIGILLCFALRQGMQALCVLSPPPVRLLSFLPSLSLFLPLPPPSAFSRPTQQPLARFRTADTLTHARAAAFSPRE